MSRTTLHTVAQSKAFHIYLSPLSLRREADRDDCGGDGSFLITTPPMRNYLISAQSPSHSHQGDPYSG